MIDSASTINPVKFLGAMYANGAAGNFDALSFHPGYDLSLADGWRLPSPRPTTVRDSGAIDDR